MESCNYLVTVGGGGGGGGGGKGGGLNEVGKNKIHRKAFCVYSDKKKSKTTFEKSGASDVPRLHGQVNLYSWFTSIMISLQSL